jgi:hypothetical protein
MMEAWRHCFLLLSLLMQEIHRRIRELVEALKLGSVDHFRERRRRLGDR